MKPDPTRNCSRRVFLTSTACALAGTTFAAFEVNAETPVARPDDMNGGRSDTKKIFYGLTDTLDEFRKLAEICTRNNGTHVFISDLAKARW